MIWDLRFMILSTDNADFSTTKWLLSRLKNWAWSYNIIEYSSYIGIKI